MKSVKEIFIDGNTHLGHQREAEPAAYIITLDVMKEKGITYDKQPPEAKACEFCGKILYPQGLVLGNKVLMWNPVLPRCTCEEAQINWHKYDAAIMERKRKEALEISHKIKRDRINKLLGQSGIKRRFQNRTFDKFKVKTPEQERCFRVAKEYADNFAEHYMAGDGLYIEGTNGTGKTHLAAAIALQLINEGIPVICKTASDILEDIKRAFDSVNADLYELMYLYKKVDLLIIDDLGKEHCSDWAISTLYSIINDRYEDLKPVIVTANYGLEQLNEVLTPIGYDCTKILAITSRLKETCSIITMAWEDIRGGGEL